MIRACLTKAVVLTGLTLLLPLPHEAQSLAGTSYPFPLEWDSNGRLILPPDYHKMTSAEFIEWYCKEFPDKCPKLTLKELLHLVEKTGSDGFSSSGPDGPGCHK